MNKERIVIFKGYYLFLADKHLSFARVCWWVCTSVCECAFVCMGMRGLTKKVQIYLIIYVLAVAMQIL